MGNGQSTPIPSDSSLPAFPILTYETSPLPRDRTLKHLLRLNHQTHSVLFHNDQFHNHLPHSMASAHALGATGAELQSIYDFEVKSLEAWKPSPHEVSRHDWQDYISDYGQGGKFQRAYLDLFEDELVRFGYDWKKVLVEYLFGGEEGKPLLFGGIGGLGHPIIHLGYAFELNNRDVAMEALTLFAINCSSLRKYLDADFPAPRSEIPPPPPPPANASTSSLEILSRIRSDPGFASFASTRPSGIDDTIAHLFTAPYEQTILSYYRQYDMSKSAAATLKDLLHTATLLLVATSPPPPSQAGQYDFVTVHALTVGYAVRVLLPEVPGGFTLPLLKMLWLFVLVGYVVSGSKQINGEAMEAAGLQQRGWEEVADKALSTCNEGEEECADAHYLKAVRVMRDLAGLWADEEVFYKRAATQFCWGFKGWGG